MTKKRKSMKVISGNGYSHIGILSKIIIVILVIGMILGHFNLGIIAKAFDEKEHIIITNNIQKDFSEVENIDEVISLRTENTKTFIKDNGMYETSYYGEKIHYYKNNEWIEIDNTLKVKDGKFHNNSNRFDVSFPLELSSYNKVTLNYLNNEVKIYYDVNNVSSKLSESVNRNSSNLKDKISYEINNSEKIEYIINQDSIKENIILNSYITNYEYSYYIDTDLRIERIGDRLYFYNGLEEIYVMNEYYMYDHDGNYSYDIDFTIQTIDNDTYKVNVIPSDSFLKGASYPVTVDPEIVIQNSGYLDNIYNVTSLDMNTNALLNRSIGTFNVNNRVSSNQDDDLKAYFDVLLPKTYTIGNVYNSIGKNQLMYANIILPTTNTSISGETEVILKEVVEFDNIELDYLDTDTFDLDYIDSEYIHSTSLFDHSFNVYNLVKSKLDLLETSDVHLKFELSISGNNNSSITYSLGGDLTGYKPKLVIGYLSDAGLADYYTYEELPISDNSDVYIAHNSGNLTYIYNDYNDNNLLNFSHIYNDNRKDINNGYGNGFSINYNEFITTYTYDERLLLKR